MATEIDRTSIRVNGIFNSQSLSSFPMPDVYFNMAKDEPKDHEQKIRMIMATKGVTREVAIKLASEN